MRFARLMVNSGGDPNWQRFPSNGPAATIIISAANRHLAGTGVPAAHFVNHAVRGSLPARCELLILKSPRFGARRA